MPLGFADFAHYYEGHSLSDEQQHVHFSAFADLLECITRMAWDEGGGTGSLGITFDDDTLALLGDVESPVPITTMFNVAASHDAAGKKES